MLLLNRAGTFEARPLPVEAQLTPVNGATVADFDGDGNEDVFLSQNFFAVRVEDYRMDAGEGMLLLGDGAGGFASVFGHRSGIKIFGEQRGCAVGDLNDDGRPDLLIAQSKGRPKLYLNALGQPGLCACVAAKARCFGRYTTTAQKARPAWSAAVPGDTRETATHKFSGRPGASAVSRSLGQTE